MALDAVIFDILGVIAVIAAAGVVLARNPVHSAVALVVTFINLAACYLLLQAEFLAAIQIIVYAGAILVLVLFVIMLVQQQNLPEFHGGRPLQRVAGFLLGLVLLGEVAAAILSSPIVGQAAEPVPPVGGNVQAIGQLLYSSYVLPIQVTALVLLAATIGALVLARPEVVRGPLGPARSIFTISLGHPRGTDTEEAEEAIAALPPTALKPEAGDRELVLARSADEFVEQPVWAERKSE
ncbi:MAG: NADH-quinone oxidoreductase subunit J [Thermomicrobiaceae bacterium]|nr:NADH-quinone oxidoreductase subunit J [Thermomicrobiaceae bacterium]